MQPVSAAVPAVQPKGRSSCRTRGPYQDRDRYRLVFIEGSKRWSEIFDTRAAALSAQRAFERRHALKDALTVQQFVDRYLEHHRLKGTKPDTVAHMESRFRTFFSFASMTDRSVAGIDADEAREAYESHARRPKLKGEGLISAATHQEDLKFIRRMFEWGVEEKLTAANPFASVRSVGRANKGKHQLSVDEATRWLTIARQMIEREGDVVALAAAVVAGTGGRNSEIMWRRVRDLDEGGTRLWVRKGKTPTSNRILAIPTMFVPYVAALAANRPPHALLFVPDEEVNSREPCKSAMRQRLVRKVKEICRLAGVDQVVPHSFRGLYATLGVCRTGDPDLIAAQLGHASSKVTTQNYIDSRVAGPAQQERIQARLGLSTSHGMLAERLPPAELGQHLAELAEALSPKELQKLIQQLLQVMASKASMPRSTRPRDRSKSNTEQVGGSIRKLSAKAFSSALSDGD
ncbi:MAG: tyrosine-type recombinase/integrase [Polyangia bacterium]